MVMVMVMNEQEMRYYIIDPILREKGYDDKKWLKCETPTKLKNVIRRSHSINYHPQTNNYQP